MMTPATAAEGLSMSMDKLLEQARQMQAKLNRELAEMVVTATAGYGAVRVQINGHRQVVGLKLDPNALQDLPALQAHVKDAVNRAMEKLQPMLERKLGPSANMPSFFEL